MFHGGSVQYILFCDFRRVKGNSLFIRGLPFYIGFPPSKAGGGGRCIKLYHLCIFHVYLFCFWQRLHVNSIIISHLPFLTFTNPRAQQRLQQRQREHQHCNRFIKQKKKSLHASCIFLCCYSTTATWKCVILRIMEDVNKQRQNFLSLFKLKYRPREINSRKICAD